MFAFSAQKMENTGLIGKIFEGKMLCWERSFYNFDIEDVIVRG